MTFPPARATFLAAAILILSLAACAPGGIEDPRKMTFPPVQISPPVPERVVAGNGTVLYLLHDDEVPLVTVQVLVRTGAVLDPPGKTGLAALAGSLLRTGGTLHYGRAELNEILEGMGADLETSVGRRSGSASLSLLAGDLERGLELLGEVLRRPRFSEDEIAKTKHRTIEKIRRVNDDPDSIAYREMRPALYGDGPLGRSATPATVASVERGDLTAFHGHSFHPDRLIVGVSGDFDREKFLELWEKYFGDWQARGVAAPPFPLPERDPPHRVFLVRKDIPQTTVLLGQFAPPLDSPEYFAFSVVNYVLGGSGFNSRLTRRIRSNRGLAYSVGSWYSGNVGYGVIAAYCSTSSATAVEVTRLMREIVDEVKREGITPQELEWAKKSIVNGLIFAVDGTAEIISRSMSYEYNGLPADFLTIYPEKIRELSLEEVNEAARTWLRPAEAPIVAVGNDSAFEGSFSEFGEVTIVPLPQY
jgi:zinc protease